MCVTELLLITSYIPMRYIPTWVRRLFSFKRFQVQALFSFETHANKAGALVGLKSYWQALQSFKTALSLNANIYEAYANKEGALLGLQKYQEALNSCARAVQIRPYRFDAYLNKGTDFLFL
jgi:tetratricopeptide (TPR) repeat protein